MDINFLREELTKIYGDTFIFKNLEECCGLKSYITFRTNNGQEFTMRCDGLLKGRAFSKIKNKTDEFIKKARILHRDKYDYSKVEYINNSEKVCIVCPIHGEFWQTPNSHLNGRGCPKCGILKKTPSKQKKTELFLSKVEKVHGGKYDYSQIDYVDNRTKIKITCPIHGEFWQTPGHHVLGEGCPKCRYTANAQKNTMTTDEFIEKAKIIHGDKYDYSKVDYKGYDEYVLIGCPKHGFYKQTPDSHLHSGGCPKCGATLSKNEDEIIAFLKKNLGEENVIERDRKTLSKREIDILIPFKKVGIEYNGLYWHSDKNPRIDKNYHLLKTIEAKKKGISLIHIFEDEFVLHKDIVFSKLSHILECSHLDKIYGRNCEIKKISNRDAKAFLEKNHIQGFSKSTVYIGAFLNNQLIGVMSFIKEYKNSNKWELNRFATDINYRCVGVGGKMFSYFIKNYNPQEIKSFADRRWTINEDDNFYTKIGFVKNKILPPDYRYYNEKIGKYDRIHKFNFRKQIISKKYGLDLRLTENNMAKELNYAKIYDCGLIKYIWKKE